MEEPWEIPFISYGRRLLQRLLNVVSRYIKVFGVAREPIRSPACPAETVWKVVDLPEAVAELCIPTGDAQLDYINVILIDLMQRGYIQAVKFNGDHCLRFMPTAAGHAFVEQYLNGLVDQFLEVTFRDN